MHFPNEKINATGFIIPEFPRLQEGMASRRSSSIGEGLTSLWRILEIGVDDMIGPWSSDFRFPEL